MKPIQKRDLEAASIEALRYQITDKAFATRNWLNLEKNATLCLAQVAIQSVIPAKRKSQCLQKELLPKFT